MPNQDKTKRILVIDDDPFMLDFMIGDIGPGDFTFIRAKNGLEGLRYLSQVVFDLVILDVMLPDLNGKKITDHIRKKYSSSELPILLVSAYFRQGKDPKDLVRKWNVQGFLSKPLQSGEIHDKVYEILDLEESDQIVDLKQEHILQESFLHHLRKTASNLMSAVAAIDPTSPSQTSMQKIESIAHRIHGAAGSYGFKREGHLAGKIESFAHRFASSPSALGQLEHQRLRYLSETLERSLVGLDRHTEEGRSQLEAQHTIVYYGQDKDYQRSLIQSAQDVSVEIQSMHSAAEALRFLRSSKVSILLVDLEAVPASPMDLIRSAMTLSRRSDLKIVCIGSADDTSVRLAMAKTGVETYFLKDSSILKILSLLQQDKPRTIKNVLHVDDDEFMLKLVRHALTSSEMRVESVRKSEQVLQRAREIMPDLILLDFELPSIKGYDLCRILKLDESLSDIPVLILSAHDEERFRIRALEAGAVGYLKKGLSPRELRLQIETVMKQFQGSEKTSGTERPQEKQSSKMDELYQINSGS